jgi:hypothetical protein
LEEKIDRGSAIEGGQLRGDVGQATGLRGNFVGIDQAIQGYENRADGLDGVGGGIYADDCVSAAVEQTFEGGQENSSDVIGRMVGLGADAEDAAFSHGIAAAGDVSYFGGGEDEVFVAHELGNGGGNFGDDGVLDRLGVGTRLWLSRREGIREIRLRSCWRWSGRLGGRKCRG